MNTIQVQPALIPLDVAFDPTIIETTNIFVKYNIDRTMSDVVITNDLDKIKSQINTDNLIPYLFVLSAMSYEEIGPGALIVIPEKSRIQYIEDDLGTIESNLKYKKGWRLVVDLNTRHLNEMGSPFFELMLESIQQYFETGTIKPVII